MAIGTAIAALLAGTWAAGMLAPDQPAAAPTAAAPATAPPPAWTDPPAVAVPPAAEAAATTWVQALLVQSGQNRQQWLARLAPLTTDEFLGILSIEADDQAAPHALVGTAAAVTGGPDSAVVEVPTDLGPVQVQLVHDGARWLVADADLTAAGAGDPVSTARGET